MAILGCMNPFVVRVLRDRHNLFDETGVQMGTGSIYNNFAVTLEMLDGVLGQIRDVYVGHLCDVGEDPTCILVGPRAYLTVYHARLERPEHCPMITLFGTCMYYQGIRIHCIEREGISVGLSPRLIDQCFIQNDVK